MSENLPQERPSIVDTPSNTIHCREKILNPEEKEVHARNIVKECFGISSQAERTKILDAFTQSKEYQQIVATILEGNKDKLEVIMTTLGFKKTEQGDFIKYDNEKGVRILIGTLDSKIYIRVDNMNTMIISGPDAHSIPPFPFFPKEGEYKEGGYFDKPAPHQEPVELKIDLKRIPMF